MLDQQLAQVMFPPNEFNNKDVRESAEEDWLADTADQTVRSADRNTMSYALFYDAIFEVTDIWTAGTEIWEYRYRLEQMLEAMTDVRGTFPVSSFRSVESIVPLDCWKRVVEDKLIADYAQPHNGIGAAHDEVRKKCEPSSSTSTTDTSTDSDAQNQQRQPGVVTKPSKKEYNNKHTDRRLSNTRKDPKTGKTSAEKQATQRQQNSGQPQKGAHRQPQQPQQQQQQQQPRQKPQQQHSGPQQSEYRQPQSPEQLLHPGGGPAW